MESARWAEGPRLVSGSGLRLGVRSCVSTLDVVVVVPTGDGDLLDFLPPSSVSSLSGV